MGYEAIVLDITLKRRKLNRISNIVKHISGSNAFFVIFSMWCWCKCNLFHLMNSVTECYMPSKCFVDICDLATRHICRSWWFDKISCDNETYALYIIVQTNVTAKGHMLLWKYIYLCVVNKWFCNKS